MFVDNEKEITVKQWNYAKGKLEGKPRTKKELALEVGYSLKAATHPTEVIESGRGYKKAMKILANKSSHILIKVMNEMNSRSLDEMSNRELMAAMATITNTWDKIEKRRELQANKDPEKNPLRSLFVKRAEVLSVKEIDVENEKRKENDEAPLPQPVKLGASSKEETYPVPTELEKALDDPEDYGLDLDL